MDNVNPDQDDRDPFQQLSENERAEYEAWSDFIIKKLKEEKSGTEQ